MDELVHVLFAYLMMGNPVIVMGQTDSLFAATF